MRLRNKIYSIFNLFWRNPFLACLIFLAVLVSAFNYQTGTWLSGWDTLHPELNFILYLKKIFFGVWQQHQGLGAVASQAHPAELARMLVYYPIILLFPDFVARYLYFFLTLLMGPLGVYFLIERIILKEYERFKKQAMAFIGALVYLLNLGTLQHYYVPLEMFATQFAFIGWLFLFATLFIEEAKKKYLVLFSITTFFAAPMAHTATLFYAYFLALIIYAGMLILIHLGSIKRAVLVLAATFLVNSFWLLPNIYFIVNHGKEVSESKIHTQFSEKAFLTSKKLGTFKDTALLRNFLFDWGEYNDQNGKFVDLFDEWMPHLARPYVIGIGYGIFIFVFLGLIVSVARRISYGLALLPVFIISFIFIANSLPVASQLFFVLQNTIPLFKEAIRFPFTKFSILLALCYAVYSAIAFSVFTSFIEKKLNLQKLPTVIITSFIGLALVYYMLPAFRGNLISSSMKVKIPNEYFEMFNWFSSQDPSGRITHLPVHTFWGWVYYSWQYEGAGFTWFGLAQPFLDREFDRWSPKNENYYWEVSYAVYSKDVDLLNRVLQKYHVKWLLVDENIISPSSAKSVYIDEIEEMLGRSNQIVLNRQFGRIKVYKVALDAPINNFVYTVQGLPNIEPAYKWNNNDVAYSENGDYVSSIGDWKCAALTGCETGNLTYYPFRSLFTGQSVDEREFELEDKGDHFILRKKLSSNLTGYYLVIPEFANSELRFIDPNNLVRFVDKSREIFFDGQKAEVRIPKINGYLSAKINPAVDLKNCNSEKPLQVKSEIIKDNNQPILRLDATDANNCSANYWLPNLPNELGYVISVKSRNVKGKPLLFWLENLNARRSDIETYLPRKSGWQTSYFIQPPMEKDGQGYTLHLDNISIGREETINDLGEITVNVVPYNFLSRIRLESGVSGLQKVEYMPVEVSHPNPSFYSILARSNLARLESSTVVLSQAYDKGWKAFQCKVQSAKCKILPFLFGKEIKEHVLVNNWANGWVVPASPAGRPDGTQRIIVIFWPQLLEYLGFGLLVGWIIYIWRFSKL